MKTKILSIVSAWVFLALNPIFAQQNTGVAKALLNKVSQKYGHYKTIQATYSLTLRQANGTSYTDAGKFYLDKNSNKYHITAKNQDIISDSKNQWTVMKSEKEVEISEAANDPNTISPNNIFTFYNSGFSYTLAKNEKAGGKNLQVVVLTPTDQRKNYSTIKLRIDAAQHLIHDVTVSEKSGNKYTYTLTSQQGNKILASSLFTFNKSNYPGYELVDLR